MNKNTKILITGSTGFLGRHVANVLKKMGFNNLIPLRAFDYDLCEQVQVRRLFNKYKPEVVINLAGVVGGINANEKRPAQFCYDNLLMGTLVLHEAFQNGALKYITCICGCGYPAETPSPIKEEYLWDGYPFPTSAPYSIAKKMSVVQAHAYRMQYNFESIILVPGNMYGPYDNFHQKDSHVIPALIRRVYEAKQNNMDSITVWGSGQPVRDFVYVEDVAEGLVKALQIYDSDEIINISSGEGVSIKDLITIITEIAEYSGEIVFDKSKPDGQAHKVFNVEKMRAVLDFECKTGLREGISKTYCWFCENYATARR